MLRVMFVDDEKLALDNMRTLLPWEEMGMQVVMCDNALEALNQMIEEQPDILIADIRMPIMDGLELIGRAKGMYPSIKCFVLSGFGEFELARMAIERGVQGYLLKPCSREELMRAVCMCAEERQKEISTASDRFDQRGRQIEQLYEELTALQPDMCNAFSVEQIRRLAQRHNDFSLLREAAVVFVMQYEAAIPELRSVIRRLSSFSCDEQELLTQTATALQAIYQSVDENGGAVDAVIRYVNDHYGVPNLTLQYVADHVVHLNAKYLGRRFLKQTGVKFGDYLLKVRMERAIMLLRDGTGLGAAAIADQVGLGNNVQYFYRLFKQYTGCTLNDYRDRLKK